METVQFIFAILFELFIAVVALGIFIQTNRDLWNEIGKEIYQNLKSKVQKWYKGTGIYMWYSNKKNNVKILTEDEYRNLLMSGNIKPIEIEVTE